MGTVLFDSLVGFEIKKMFLNKITITMLILCMGFLFGFTMLRYHRFSIYTNKTGLWV